MIRTIAEELRAAYWSGFRDCAVWTATAIVFVMMVTVLFLVTGCATIPDPATPTGPVTSADIIAHQAALVRSDADRERQAVRRTRAAVWGCTLFDALATLYVIRERDDAREANPLLPNPRTQPAAFITVKLSVAAVMDWSARRGHHREVRISSGMMCGAGIWNLTQAVK